MKRNLLLVIGLVAVITVGCKKSGTCERVMEIINSEQYTAENIQQISNIITESTDLTEAEADSLQLEVGSFIRQYAEHFCDSINGRLSDPTLTGEQMRDLLSDIGQLSELVGTTGVDFFKSEGSLVYDISPIFIADIFRHYMTAEEYALTEIEQAEFEQPTAIDEEITISYQDVADRLWACDQLMMKAGSNPDIAVMVKPYTNTYIKALMYGAENTPTFDWNTNRMLPEVKDAIMSYVNDHPDAPSATVLNQYIDVLKRSNFVDCQATRQFYFKYLREN